ncbi:nuclear transport factor 2 family protein [Mesorhizobium sp. WSM4904]|uniref:nuclear transport factor 2 family protein n=1 Tax=Mesorhizobium sp. WSM4904 TaxID=3038545 RepID=UPI002418AC25|nr:nuclear transport factor 2 family protein [Mesorhizobium sp. WSM4904]WFP62456.1 nuclear transport factor 2 family protein [Mesorhizobium sp. WSM4904]
MSVALPGPIGAYFAADRNDFDVAFCFTENAVVVDERQIHLGREAIRRWRAEASRKYSYVAEPLAVSDVNGQTMVTARLSGNFPGSPVDLRYAFVLEKDQIARLEITL